MSYEMRVLTPQGAADTIGANKGTVYRWIKEKRFKATKIKQGLIFIYNIDKESFKAFCIERGYLESNDPTPPPAETPLPPPKALDKQKALDQKALDKQQKSVPGKHQGNVKFSEKQYKNESKLFIIKVLGASSDNFIDKIGKLTANKADAMPFINKNQAQQYIKNQNLKVNNCKIIEK